MPPTNDDTQQVNNVWGQQKLNVTSFLTLPSGQTCHAKPVGLQGIMEAGLLGGADSLTAFVGRHHLKKRKGANGVSEGKDELDTASLMRDPATLQKIVKLIDQAVPMVVTSPKVACHFSVDERGDTKMIASNDRDPDLIYTDQIGLEDKMFLFNFATGGVRDAESFRQESRAAVGDVADVQGVSDHTQPAGENRAERRKRPSRRR